MSLKAFTYTLDMFSCSLDSLYCLFLDCVCQIASAVFLW